MKIKRNFLKARMMNHEILYNVLTKETDQSQIARFIQEQNNNSNFGNILFQILQNDSTIKDENSNFILKCCFLLKNWAKVNWDKMSVEQKVQYFQNLKQLILTKQQSYVLNLSDAFIDIAKREFENKNNRNLNIYEIHYNDFFNALSSPQNCSVQQLTAILYIINYASRKYRSSKGNYNKDESSFFLTKVVNILIPYLGNVQLLQSQEGCDILGLVLSIFINTFLRVKPPIENASIPFNFSENIEIEFIKHNFTNSKLVCSAVRFLKKLYQSQTYKKNFKKTAQNILQTNFQLLLVALEPKTDNSEPDYYLISKILKSIELFVKYITPQQNIINILLQSAKLTPTDITNFASNPNMFYDDVYKTLHVNDKNNSPPRLSRSILSNIICMNSNISNDLINYMISLPPAENIIRCVGLCIKVNEEYEDSGLPSSIIQYYLQLIQNPNHLQNPFLVASVLDFLRYLVPFLPVEQKVMLMQLLPNYFANFQQSVIITLLCTKLLKKLLAPNVPPFQNAIQAVIQILPYSFTPDALKCIKKLLEITPEAVLPYADTFLESVFQSLIDSLNLIPQLENQNDLQLEKEIDNFESNIVTCAKLINGAGQYLVKPYFLQIVKSIFENELTDLEESLVTFLISVFNSGSPLISDFLRLIIEACQQEVWEGHSGQLISPLFELISSHPQLFIQLNVSQFLFQFCFKFLTNETKYPRNYLQFSCLLSWILMIDAQSAVHVVGQNDIQTIIQFANTIISTENVRIELVSSFLEILATIAVSYNILPNEAIIHLMVNSMNSNWALRICQKQLYSIFFFKLAVAQNSVANLVVPIAFNLCNEMIKQKTANNGNDYFKDSQFPKELEDLTFDFSFRSPIENFPLAQIAVQALQSCQKETVDAIKGSFPDVFNQIIQQQQQQQQQPTQ